MMDYICIDTTPSGEECTSVNDFDALRFMRIEARVYIQQLRRVYGENPPGTQFKIKHNDHDAGTYLNIHLCFDEDVPEQLSYVLTVDEGCEFWDDESKQQLESLGYAFPTKEAEDPDEEDRDIDEFNEHHMPDGPTGHGDICMSDADPGL